MTATQHVQANASRFDGSTGPRISRSPGLADMVLNRFPVIIPSGTG